MLYSLCDVSQFNDALFQTVCFQQPVGAKRLLQNHIKMLLPLAGQLFTRFGIIVKSYPEYLDRLYGTPSNFFFFFVLRV